MRQGRSASANRVGTLLPAAWTRGPGEPREPMGRVRTAGLLPESGGRWRRARCEASPSFPTCLQGARTDFKVNGGWAPTFKPGTGGGAVGEALRTP